MNDIKIVSPKDAIDENKYAYAICECITIGIDYGIQIPRKKYNDFVKFKCPRCGKELGMYVRGTDKDCDYFNAT